MAAQRIVGGEARIMTLPNKITVSRLILTPVFYLLFICTVFLRNNNYQAASVTLTFVILVFWIIMEISDIADGHIARKRGLVSDLGKIMDPFSDVISRITYFYLFVQIGFLPAWPLIIIFWRELSITFIRAVLNKNGITLAASSGGKTKAVFYFATSAVGFFLFVNNTLNFLSVQALMITRWVAYISFILSALAAVISFIGYFNGFIKTEYMQKVIKE
jgi:CDP-diacylglycerol--glycerol-3-phosphate 3-phosphatidyltransferase